MSADAISGIAGARFGLDLVMEIRDRGPADSSQLLEPALAALQRRIKAALSERLGIDGETGQRHIGKVLIAKCTQFRADS